jgi:hypothetical protein
MTGGDAAMPASAAGVAAEATPGLPTFRPRPGTTVALCGAPAVVAVRYLAAYLRRRPRVATVVVADDDPDRVDLHAARLERADQVVVLNGAGVLRWPAAWAVAYATAAGKPIWWLRRPIRRCPVCRGHAVALVAAGLAWCETPRCGWVGDDTAAASLPDDTELQAGFLLEAAGGHAARAGDPVAGQATADPPTAPQRFHAHATQAAVGGTHPGRRRWLR